MARLIVNPGQPTAWEIDLKPGTNTIGRGFANDFKITDPSVSGSHCQITIDNGNATIKDLGSTNGTFVNRARVSETPLQAGQTVHLGGVEMMFHSDAPVIAAPPRAAATIHVSAPPAPAAPPMPAPMTPTGDLRCKFHPKTAGRHFCNHCQLAFCDLCVTSRQAGGALHKFCRKCGAETVALQVQVQRAVAAPSFYRQLPGAFAYPARGTGILVLMVCAVLLFGLDFMANRLMGSFFYFIIGLGVKMVAYGYLFSFMQTVIHSTTAGDQEMPGLPPFEGLFGAFGRLFGAALISFGAAFALYLVAFFNEESSAGSVFMIPALVLGCIYFPMALLAVAMKDTALAANPLIVIPAIFKAPLEYLITVLVMGGIMAVRWAGDPLIHTIFPRGLTTHNMTKLLGFLSASAFWNLMAVYILAINMRMLGLLYLSKKQKFGWFEH